MMICEVPKDRIKEIIESNGLKATDHAVKRLKQRLAPVRTDMLEHDLKVAYNRYKSGKARRKNKVRLSRKGPITRKEYYVRVGGVTYVFSGNMLISVFV